MTRIIPYLLYLWLLAMHEVFLKDVTSLWGATINIGILLVLFTAVYKSDIAALWVGFTVGLIGYSGTGPSWGWHILMLVIIAATAYQIKERMNLDSIRAKVLLLLGGVIVHNILVLLLSLPGELDIFYWLQLLGGTVYTTILGWLYFMIKEKKITGQKIKDIF